MKRLLAPPIVLNHSLHKRRKKLTGDKSTFLIELTFLNWSLIKKKKKFYIHISNYPGLQVQSHLFRENNLFLFVRAPV